MCECVHEAVLTKASLRRAGACALDRCGSEGRRGGDDNSDVVEREREEVCNRTAVFHGPADAASFPPCLS